jgi:hypothetical protein
MIPEHIARIRFDVRNSERGLRLRAALDRWFDVVVVVLLVSVVLGGWLSYDAFVDPETRQEQRTVDEWRVSGSFSHQAVVTDSADGSVFQPGAVVSDREVYFYRVMPVVDGELLLAYEGADAPLDLTVERRLVVRSVDASRRGADSTVYWQQNRSLGTAETALQPNERASVPFRVNVTQTLQEARTVNNRLGSPGHVQASIRVTVDATRGIAGAETRRLTFTLPIDAETGVYRVRNEPREETFARTETVTVTKSNPVRETGGPLLLVVGLVGAAGLILARSRNAIAPTDDEREWLTFRTDRVDYDDWISTIRLPEETATRPRAEADRLADLVDFAIDTDNAVLESPDGDAYYVLAGDHRYVFETPPAPTDGHLDAD